MAKGQKRTPAPAPTSPKSPKKRAKAARKELARRLRSALTGSPITIAQMVEALAADEDAVLGALRRLGKRRKSYKGRLHSGMVAGRPCWWWEPAALGPEPEATAAEAPPAAAEDPQR
jgi:hypothetical protein